MANVNRPSPKAFPYWLLITSLMLLGVAMAGLVGYFSHRSAQEVVAPVATYFIDQRDNPVGDPSTVPKSVYGDVIQANVQQAWLWSGLTLVLSGTASILIARRLSRAFPGLTEENPPLTADDGGSLSATEQALRESQHLVEKIAEMTPDLLYIYDHIEQRNVYANRSVAEMLGYSPVEIQAMGDRLLPTVIHPDDFPRVMEVLQQMKAAHDGEVIEWEYRVRDRQGALRWLVSRDIVFKCTAEGQVWQTLGAAQDITERKEFEFEVQRIQNFLSSIIENIPDIIFVKDAKTLKYITLNQAFENTLGFSKDDFLGKTDYDLFPADQADLFASQDSMILSQGEMLTFPGIEIQTHSQENRILRTKKIPIFDDAGQVQYLLGISEDVTEQLELENRLSQLVRHAPGMLYQFHLKPYGTTCLPYVSEGIREIYGVGPEEVKHNAQVLFEVVYQNDVEQLNQSIFHSAERLTPWRCEFRICLTDKTITWLLGYATPRREADGSTIWHGYITDITEQKVAESLLIAEKERAEAAELQLQKAQIHLERVNQRLNKLLDLDGLTKVANRRCFNIRLKQEWVRLYRDQKPLSLILFDVDYFKNYNDCYGHPQGDTCLTKIAQRAKKVVQRPADLVARYGGEEFAVILPNTDAQGAMMVAQKINEAVHRLAIAHQGSDVADHVTVSLGVATQIPHSDSSVTSLIAQADAALYQAKNQGRNQVVSFTAVGGKTSTPSPPPILS
ncbi:MAG: diguanylate cyclase [Synechocystis sp.]|nr:diguanylate cyclase [Synechocystis sp.]